MSHTMSHSILPSGMVGSACIVRGWRQSVGSREIIRTVPSVKPTAKNRHRISPWGTSPTSSATISEPNSLRSKFEF